MTSSLVQISAVLAPMFGPMSGFKLLMVDQYASSGKAKVVLVAKDTTPGSIRKGPAAAPPGDQGPDDLDLGGLAPSDVIRPFRARCLLLRPTQGCALG